MTIAVLAGNVRADSNPSSNSSADNSAPSVLSDSFPALANTEFKFSGKLEAMAATFSNDYFNCWNDGNAKNCSNQPKLILSESFLRADAAHDLNDDLVLIGRVQEGMYVHNTWYTTPNGTPANPQYDANNPRLFYAEIEDTWLGLKDDRYGTMKVGSGINPRMQALEGDGTTTLGGYEMLDEMVSYDSPILIGESSTGVKFSYAHYHGTHMRKQIRQYDSNDQNSMNHVEPTGDSILLNGTWHGKLNVRFAYYIERYAARDSYDGGYLDGINIGTVANPIIVPNTGAMTHSHGPALRVAYEFSNARIGLSVSDNHRDKVTMENPDMPAVGYDSHINTLFVSAWTGPWGLYGKVTTAKFRISENVLPNNSLGNYDWLYPNNTYDVFQYGGEISYEFLKNTRFVTGYDYKIMTFYNSPTAGGVCNSGQTTPNPCYNPRGYKVYTGVRWTF
jgi:hypothetical protein